MPDVVICNTSPLFYLHRLRHLAILRQLYHQFVVPEAVCDELHVGRMQGEDTPELEAYAWITVRTVRVPEVIQLITDLGPGEAQVLALALEEPGRSGDTGRWLRSCGGHRTWHSSYRYRWCPAQGQAGRAHSCCRPATRHVNTAGISAQRRHTRRYRGSGTGIGTTRGE